MDADNLHAFIEEELATLSDDRVLQHIRRILVPPYVILRDWDYGDEQYACWVVLADVKSGGEIAYCEHGFGPRCPWGLISSGDDPRDRGMGQDSGWFTSFLDAFFDSFAAVALPIWRVVIVARDGADTAVTEEGAWDDVWALYEEFRCSNPAVRYGVGHSISYGGRQTPK